LLIFSRPGKNKKREGISVRQKPVSVQMKKRIQVILLLVSLAFLGIFGRLVWIQLFKGSELKDMAYENRFRNIEIKARRGVIYDTKGRPLAISISTDSFYANPPEVKKGDVAATAQKLAEILERDPEDILKLLNQDKQFVWIQRKVTKEKADAIKALNLRGIKYVEEPERFYPKDSLLANVLGFVGIDNNGLNGVEASYDKILSGTPGTLMVEYDSRSQSIPEATQKYIEPKDGSSIVLTIDETIQYIAERELKKLVETHQPKQAGILVMDPYTGGVLAMAVTPTYDPNKYAEYDQSTWRNFLVSDVYEPGSTFKTIVMAGALEEGICTLESRFYCGGAVKVKGGTVRCWRHGRPHGSQTFMEGVQNSCNPVFVNLGLQMGTDLFYKYVTGFGFGAKTGIDLPGEATGLLVSKNKATELDLATMSIGQSNAVTPIQLLTAFSAICNGGKLMKPHIVKEIRDQNGEIIEVKEPTVVRQVISAETSKNILKALETVVSQGTGKTAYIEGFRVGGKTGTAQKIIPGGGYSTTDYIPSFMGVAPSNDPRIVCLVVADSPKGGVHTGSAVCAPTFKNVVEDTLSYLQVPSQVEPEQVKASSLEKVSVADLTGKDTTEAIELLKSQNLQASVIGEGKKVIAQLPLPNTEMLKGNTVVLYTKMPDSIETTQQIPVPELTGKTREEINRIAENVNLNFEIIGEGIAMYQVPEPGVMVKAGSKVTVNLELLGDIKDEPAGP